MKKIFRATILMAIIATILATAVYATETVTTSVAEPLAAFSDADLVADWAESGMINAVRNEIIRGKNNRLDPKGYLTRAELSAILVRVLNVKSEADIAKYRDILPTDWFANDIKKGVAAKIIQGSGDIMNPNGKVTRQETNTIIARAFCFYPKAQSVLNAFVDANKVATWATDSTVALVENKIVLGATGAKLNPADDITREEFTTMLNRIVSNYLMPGSEYGEVIEGGVVINTPIDKLENVVIKGNLYIEDGVEVSEIALENVIVEGEIVVRGGSVAASGGSSAGVVFGNPSNPVKFDAVASGSSAVGGFSTEAITFVQGGSSVETNLSANSAKVIGDNLTINITDGSKINNVEIIGKDNSIVVSGAVEKIGVTQQAANVKIEVREGAEVDTIDSATDDFDVSGKGNVSKVIVTSEGAAVKVKLEGAEIEVKREDGTEPDKETTPDKEPSMDPVPGSTPDVAQLPGGGTPSSAVTGLYVTYSTDEGATYNKYYGTVAGRKVTLDLNNLYTQLSGVSLEKVLIGSINLSTNSTATCYQDGLLFSFPSNEEVTLSSLLEQIAAHNFEIVPVAGNEETNLAMLCDRMETANVAYEEFAEHLFNEKDIVCESDTKATFTGRLSGVAGDFELVLIVPPLLG